MQKVERTQDQTTYFQPICKLGIGAALLSMGAAGLFVCFRLNPNRFSLLQLGGGGALLGALAATGIFFIPSKSSKREQLILCCDCEGRELQIWNSRGKLLSRPSLEEGILIGRPLPFKLNGEVRILVTPSDGTLRIWDQKGKELATLSTESSRVVEARIFNSTDGGVHILGWHDETLQLWDGAGNSLATFLCSSRVRGAEIFEQNGEIQIMGWLMDNTLNTWAPDKALINSRKLDFYKLDKHVNDSTTVVQFIHNGIAHFLTSTSEWVSEKYLDKNIPCFYKTIHIFDENGNDIYKESCRNLNSIEAFSSGDKIALLHFYPRSVALSKIDPSGVDEPLPYFSLGDQYQFDGAQSFRSNGELRILSRAPGEPKKLVLLNEELEVTATLEGYDEQVTDVRVFELNGEVRILTWSYKENALRVWNGKGEWLKTLNTGSPVRDVQPLHPGGKTQFAVALRDDSFLLWDGKSNGSIECKTELQMLNHFIVSE